MKKVNKSHSYTSSPDEVFYPPVVPDKTEEYEKQWQESQKIEEERALAEKRHQELLKQQRIFNTIVDKYTHAINTIIEWTEMARKTTNPIEGGSITIDYYHFNFEDRWDTSKVLFQNFLNELKEEGCFKAWTINPYRPHDYLFDGVNIDKLKQYKDNKIKLREKQNEVSDSKNKLVFYIKTGELLYVAKSGKRFETILRPEDNPYKLLIYLLQYPGKEFLADDLATHLNSPRRNAESALPDRRIRDTIHRIRILLGVRGEDDFFIIKKGKFGINCYVELRS